jgi:hypothetical protein
MASYKIKMNTENKQKKKKNGKATEINIKTKIMTGLLNTI